MGTYNLFLDDERMPIDCIEYCREQRYQILDWQVVRSHSAFISIIEEKWLLGDFPKLISFDHDLDEEHYEYSMCSTVEAYEKLYSGVVIPTGLHSAIYLTSFCTINRLLLPECLIHTKNRIGGERIIEVLSIFRQRSSAWK
jgi:hypothetical protein